MENTPPVPGLSVKIENDALWRSRTGSGVFFSGALVNQKMFGRITRVDSGGRLPER
ncbi:hypothetical protein [Planotetraspora kaengkrachanensis]|uniref:hypothetical protein n=1 Tax=Planotetraspora kaengkrachanensis TaxID=575193 RepID=UPI001940536F|nr:hypothetical protein [Planotetraspora kaengkrachanensis]